MKRVVLLVALLFAPLAWAQSECIGTVNCPVAGSITASPLKLTQVAINFGLSPYTVAAGVVTIDCDASGGAVTINLPAASQSGRMIRVKKTDSSANGCTLTRAGADTIDGATTVALTAQYASTSVEDSATAGSWIRTHVNQLGGALSGTSTNSALVSPAVVNTVNSNAGTALALATPAQTAANGASQAGKGLTITADPAVASLDTAGAAAGGPVTITAGAAARNTSGNANGGDINLTPGAGIGTGTPGKVVVAGSGIRLPLGAYNNPALGYSGGSAQGIVFAASGVTLQTAVGVAYLGPGDGNNGGLVTNSGHILGWATDATAATPTSGFVASTKALTNNTATGFAKISLASDKAVSGVIKYSVRVTDTVNHFMQASYGEVPFSAINENGTITVSTLTAVDTSQTLHAASTDAISFDSTATATDFTIRVTSNTSLTATAHSIDWIVVLPNYYTVTGL